MSLLSRLAVQAARAYGILSSNPNNVSADYLVVAGGAGGGFDRGGGGGAGGYRTGTTTLSALTTYSVTVGAGGNGSTTGANKGSNGSNSVFSTITSAGGGGGGSGSSATGADGGSGGGGRDSGGVAGGNGNTPSTSPSQGNNGGVGGIGSSTTGSGGGGGGAGAVGNAGKTTGTGVGGAGTASTISGSSVTYAGGGGGGAGSAGGAAGGSGGGGAGSGSNTAGIAGTANTGGGGGGGGDTSGNGGAGGSGIVIISYTSATPKFVGGTITTSGGKQIHTFTSSGTLSPITPITASYLVVAGGGGTANNRGGGGGGGGLLTGSTTIYSGATYVVTVGAGGAGAAGNANSTSAQDGSNSVFSGTGLTTLTSIGGGGGGGTGVGRNGGSGGGGSGDNPSAGGTGTSGQGFAGGSGATNGGGGGGGSGAIGSNGSTAVGGNGGVGTASSISGTSTYYAGGGGGGANTTAGTGGLGGGGNGAAGSPTPQLAGVSGTANTGGGGGGGSNWGATPVTQSAGGSGIVIISYAGSQVFNGGLVTTSGGNTIHTFTSTGALTPLTNNLNNSLRFRSSASAYLSRTPASAGNRRTFTWSAWVKRSTLTTAEGQYLFEGYPGSGKENPIIFGEGGSNDKFSFYAWNGSGFDFNLKTTQVFRDISAWYHFVVAVDTTQATSSNRIKIYVNGNQISAFDASTYPSQNYDMAINNNTTHHIGTGIAASSRYFDGYQTDINFIDGQQLEPYYFGNNDVNGVWKPIQYKGTYGTNGFYLTFGNTTSTTTLGYDSSPNGNNWTCNNISLTAGSTYDAMTDVPTNTSATVANYAVLNPTIANTTNLINANLTRNGAVRTNVASMVCTNGKYYFETTIQDSNGNGGVGVKQTTAYPLEGYDASKCATYFANGEYKIEGGTQTSGFSTYTNGDVIGIAIDTTLSTPKIWFAKNNTWQGTGDPTTAGYSLTSGLDYYFAILHTSSASSTTASANFGQRAFSYTPPTGYVALNTYNLPTPTILQGNKYMDATLYTGTGVSNTVVNQGQFKPDLVWMKARNATQWNLLFDSVRGVGKWLTSNNTTAEVTDATSLTTFNSNGFAVSTDPAVSADTGWNASGNTMVGWQWQAGQGSTSSNTSGSITSTVSVNTTAGFSVVTYTGTGANATVGHGLGVAPKMIIFKGRSTTFDWMVYHTSLGNTNYLRLSATNASAASISAFNNTSPTSTVFSLGDGSLGNQASATQVAYCWAEIAGFSKFGSYTGNGSADGPFVYTGFRPKFVLIKYSSGIENWAIWDTSRNTYNVMDTILRPDSTAADTSGSTQNIDFVSNGFKIRGTDGKLNTSSGTYIYAAFAENPAKISNAR